MEQQYPQLIDRIQSTFIDLILVVILAFVCSSILENYDNVPGWLRITLFVILFIAYEPLCTTFGFTLGNYMKDIRVRQSDDEARRINFVQAFIRYVVKLSLGWISFLTIHSNAKRRAIHDFISGSVMIKLQDEEAVE